MVAEIVRIHRPTQLVRDAPEGVAQLSLIGVGHSDFEVKFDDCRNRWLNAFASSRISLGT